MRKYLNIKNSYMIKIKTRINLILQGGKATPTPPIGPVLGQHGINIVNFCRLFNESTKDNSDLFFPVNIIIYENKTFDFSLKTPTCSSLIKKYTKNDIRDTNKKIITHNDLLKIAEIKKEDMNTTDLQKSLNCIKGTLKNMKINIVE
jgi:large subunit ribosomal protein L11